MSVLVVGPVPPPYHGVSVCTKLILGSAGSSRYQVVHLDTSDRRSLENVGQLDWRNVVLGLKHLLAFLHRLLSRPPDLIHFPICQSRLGFLRDAAFLLPARFLRKRVLLHLHGSRFRRVYESCGPLERGLVRAVLRGRTSIIVLSESLRSLFAGLVGEPRVHVLPNGVAELGCVGAERHGCSRQEGEGQALQVLFFGTLTRTKGLEEALEAARILAERGCGVRFVFAGGFLCRSDQCLAERLVREYGLGDRVLFRGVTSGRRKTELFRESDVFLLASHDEGQPLVIIEAMASALPVVSTTVGAIPETVVDGWNGILVPPGAPEAIADAVATLARDPALRRRMSENSLLRYRRCYTPDAFLSGLHGIWERALAT